MRIGAFSAIVIAGLAATTAPASAGGSIKDSGPAAPAASPVFGEIMGMWGFGAAEDWQLFGPNVISGPEMSKGGFGDGPIGKVTIGVMLRDKWDMSGSLQIGRFGTGSNSEEAGGGNVGELSAKMIALDGLVGYRYMMGATSSRIAVGVRHAEWNHDVNPQGDRHIDHDWSGTGPRVEWSARMPVNERTSIHADIGASYLFGRLDTSASAGWNCSDCTNYDSNSFNVDGRLGLAFSVAPGSDLVVGYRAEYWSGVNVKITDNTDYGGNQGKSAAIVHGPFVSLKLGFAP